MECDSHVSVRGGGWGSLGGIDIVSIIGFSLCDVRLFLAADFHSFAGFMGRGTWKQTSRRHHGRQGSYPGHAISISPLTTRTEPIEIWDGQTIANSALYCRDGNDD